MDHHTCGKTTAKRAALFVWLCLLLFSPSFVQAQDWCVPPDPDYCVTRVCQKGEGDCDPGQCAAGLICVNDVGAQYGLPAHYDVCEAGSSGGADPDYCVNNYCGIGDGDCDPGQCDEGTCVNDVGANYGLPGHYDVCEAVAPPPPPTTSGVGQFLGTWRFTNSRTTQTYRFAHVEPCRGNMTASCAYDDAQGAGVGSVRDLLGSADILGFTYALVQQQNALCRVYLLTAPTGNTVQGLYGSGSGSCFSNTTIATIEQELLSQRYPTTGTRISRAATAPLSQEMADEVPSAELQEQLEDALEGLFLDLPQ